MVLLLGAHTFKSFFAKGRAVAVTQKLPTKNILMKRKKLQSSFASSKHIQSTKSGPSLENILFKQDKSRIKAYKQLKSDCQVRSQQRQVQENWARFTTQRQVREYFYEQKISESKIIALKELASFPKLYEHAKVIDYNLPPVNRRIVTLLPPFPDKFPFTQ